MKACIVLAGGLGTRLRSAVPDLPKCLAPVNGRPFLEWQLSSLAKRGVDHFILALGHGAEPVSNALTSSWASDLSIDYVIEPEALGTGGAACFAMAKAGLQEALIVNGDTFLGGSLSAMLTPLDLKENELMRMATVEVPNRSRFGGVSVDSSNCVTAFLEKGHAGAGLINAGLYRVHRNAFNGESLKAFSLENSVMPRLVERRALQARQLDGPFIDIGVPEDYRLFNEHIGDYVDQEERF